MITGSVLDTTSSDTILRNVHDPTLFTGYLFKEMLEKKGLFSRRFSKTLFQDAISRHLSRRFFKTSMCLEKIFSVLKKYLVS